MNRDELLALVLADTDLLWGLHVTPYAYTQLAGPWSWGQAAVRVRPTLTDPAAIVCLQGDRWWAQVWRSPKPQLWGGFTTSTHPTQQEAEDWCDARLREAGWRLATGELR